jgi:hypothetical protein
MSATFTEARDDILTLFKTAWDTTGYTVVYDDLPGDIPDTSTPWARVTVRHQTGRQQTLVNDVGQRKFLREGVIIIQIFIPSGEGLSLIDSLAKIVADAFEGKSTTSGVWFRNVRLNEIGADGNWFNANVLIDFEYNELK